MSDEKQRFPLNPVALKIVGDGILLATLLRSVEMPAEQALTAALLALGISIATGAAAGMMLVRSGHRALWDATSLACLLAMAGLLAVNGILLAAAILSVFAWLRWRQLGRVKT